MERLGIGRTQNGIAPRVTVSCTQRGCKYGKNVSKLDLMDIHSSDNLRRQQELNAQLSAIARENDEKRRREKNRTIQGVDPIGFFVGPSIKVHNLKYPMKSDGLP